MPRATKVTATARRARVAANLISPTPLTSAELAPELGITVQSANNLMRDPDTRAIARSMLEPYRHRVMGLVPKSLQRIEEAMDATVEVLARVEKTNEDGETEVVVETQHQPDHAMRLRGADRLRRLVEVLDRATLQSLQLGQPQVEDGKFRGTLEDLIVTYRQLTLTQGKPH
jgi:hypothetical protein